MKRKKLKEKADNPKAGRKTLYETQVRPHLSKIRAWRAKGMTEDQICKKLDISHQTMAVYKRTFTELVEALKKGLDESVAEVEGALFKRALGYEYTETKTVVEEVTNFGVKMLNEDGTPLTTTRTETVVKQMAPDVGAMVFYLKNRAPEEWKDKHEIEGSGLRGMSDADIITRLVEIAKSAESRVGRSASTS